jgi:outer membrane protein
MRSFIGVLAVLFVSLGPAEAQPLKLTLDQAIAAALENNPRIRIAAEQTSQAQIHATEARADLLPQINGVGSFARETVNLSAAGFQFPGLPNIAGPFIRSETRIEYSMKVLDRPSFERYQAAKTITKATALETDAVKNDVASEAARLYSDGLRSIAAVSAIEAQIQLDGYLVDLAKKRREAGIGTRLEITRAESRMASDRQQLIEAQNVRRSAELHLLRAMGQRLDEQIELTDSPDHAALGSLSIEQAVEAALQHRPEWQAQRKRMEAARQGQHAARSEKLPTVQAFASYADSGASGPLVPNYLAGIQVSMPLFDGGKRNAHQLNASSRLREEEIRTHDVREQIELEVRLALDHVRSTREQSLAAEQNLQLATEELELANLRFQAEIAIQIEVVQAQAELAEARSRQVAAKFAGRVAVIDLRHATGSLLKADR